MAPPLLRSNFWFTVEYRRGLLKGRDVDTSAVTVMSETTQKQIELFLALSSVTTLDMNPFFANHGDCQCRIVLASVRMLLACLLSTIRGPGRSTASILLST